MRIRIHTDDVRCLGRACFSLMEHLEEKRHVVDINVVWFDDNDPLVDDAAIQLNIIVAGSFILKRLAKHGLPKKSKNLLWLVDPLPSDPASDHYYKTAAFMGFASQLDGLAAMNSLILDFATSQVAGLPLWILPYRLSPRFIRTPLNDEQRTVNFLHMAHMSLRRERAEEMLKKEGIEFQSIRGGVWLDHRDNLLRGVRILFQIHLDEHHYFDQVRIVDAWSLGTAVICEDVADMKNYPVEGGKHLVAGKLSDFPRLGMELLKNRQGRDRMIKDAQELVLEQFTFRTVSHRVDEILGSIV